MITFANVPGAYVPETDGQQIGEMMGRANALHDWLRYKATGYLDADLRTVCVLMGYKDVLEAKEDK